MTIKCKMCGGDLIITEGRPICECEYCGSMQTIPNVDSEKKMNLFNRANRLRRYNEFDKASAVYEQIVAEFPNEAEAYWGLCLCNYGIEYVDDPATGKKMPTCHRTLSTSIIDDPNFEQALDNADPIARKVYREEATEIDRIQKNILSIAANESPYDVFICYKESADDSKNNRTEDSVLAQEIYDALTEKGLKVFFSRITLEDKLGTQYEPYIYAALSSAKVMLAVGTKFDYYDSAWVKNEWSRFLHMMKTDRQKSLIPCFKDLVPDDLPREFKELQSQDMSKLGWLQDLTRGVMKMCGKGAAPLADQNIVREVIRETVRTNNADNLMKRVYLFLDDGDTKQAAAYINKVLDIDAEYAPAYVAKVVIAHGLTREDDLQHLRKSIDKEKEWQKALRFADAQQKQKYEKIAQTIREQEISDQKQAAYNQATAYMDKQNHIAALLAFQALGDYRDSRDNLKKCTDELHQLLLLRNELEAERRLLATRGCIPQASRDVQQAQLSLRRIEEQKTAVEKNQQELSYAIRTLNIDLSQVRGLFTGKKKQELRDKIDVLHQQLEGINRRQKDLETASRSAKEKLKSCEAILAERNAQLSKAEEQAQRATQLTLSDEAVISAARVMAAREAALQPGSHVTFGGYPQTAEGADSTPIEWLILKRNGQNALVVSCFGLDAQPYHSRSENVTWETCSLRGWLNDTFLNKAFTAAEQAGILTTDVDNSKSQCYSGYNAIGGSNTQDKLFLLSYAEAGKYLGETRDATTSPVALTAYAISQGAGISASHKASTEDVSGMWWLRSPGSNRSNACLVSFDGIGILDVSYEHITIRPAMWLDLSFVIDYSES